MAYFSASLACHTHAKSPFGFRSRLSGLLFKYVWRYPPLLCPDVVTLSPMKDCRQVAFLAQRSLLSQGEQIGAMTTVAHSGCIIGSDTVTVVAKSSFRNS